MWDEWMFRLINGNLHNAFFDVVLPFWRNKLIWIPLYLFLLVFFLLNFRKQSFFIILFAAATISVCDIASSKIIKPTIARVRPCNDAALKKEVKLLVPCGGGYSFTSSHATNHFGIGVFLMLVLRWKWSWLFLVWAGSIAFSQVYVGVHYPLDVIFGAFLGSLLGYLVGKFCLLQLQLKQKLLDEIE